jgi:hypothetical protein
VIDEVKNKLTKFNSYEKKVFNYPILLTTIPIT